MQVVKWQTCVAAAVLLLATAAATSCDLLKKTPPDPQNEVRKQLNLLQIALEENVPPQGTTVVAVVAVVDTAAMAALPEDGKVDEEAAANVAAAQSRERTVRQELNNVLVANTLIDVVQPEQPQIDAARHELIATNSAALSAPLALSTGTALNAVYLVCAIVDAEGAKVNLAAQQAEDGKVVYQGTLEDWSILLPETSGEAAAE